MTSRPVDLAYRPSETAAPVNETLQERVFELVYGQMRALNAGHPRELDDLVQDAMEQVLRSLPAFEGRAKLSTWTYRICYHTLLKRRRWYGRWLKRFALTSSGELPEVQDPEPSGASALEVQERELRLRAALQQLSPKKRAVVVMHDLEGLSSEEIAEVVSAKLGTVRSRLRDGRQELLQVLRNDPFFGAHS